MSDSMIHMDEVAFREAAERMRRLEAALREIAEHPWSVLNEEYHSAETARKALGDDRGQDQPE